MTKNDYPEFAKTMAALAVLLNEELTAERGNLYFNALEQYPIEQIKRAADKLSKTMRFFPKPADFVEAIEGSTEDRASQAWYNFEIALDKPGPYKTLDLRDPFAHATIADMDLWGLGIERNGYPDQRKDYDFIRQEFIRRYRVHAKHSNPAMLPQSLPGIFEEENRKKIAAGEHFNWTPGQLAFVEKQHPGILQAPTEKKQIEAPDDKEKDNR